MNEPGPAEKRIWRTCPLCGTEGGEVRLTKGSLRIVCCTHCAMLFANPVEAQFAEGAFYDRLVRPFYLSPDKLESDFAPVRFDREIRCFRRFCRKGNVLDVGCSTGGFLHQLTIRFPSDYNLLGADVAGLALDYAESRGLRVLREPFLGADFAGQRFDGVTFWAVLEHVTEPRKFLAKAATLLKPGGHCFVLVPNMKSLAVRLIKDSYRYIMPEHLNYFTRETLARLVAPEGTWQLLTLRSTHFNPMVICQDWRRGNRHVAEADRARLLRKTTAWKQSIWMRPAKWVYRAMESTLGRLGLADNLLMVLRRR
jgi:2-polyprenyl-3-methyl-5-hydroxy-6-metoxy-1,4-benzoquinol methylase